MIATRRGLLVLAVVASALLGVLVIDLSRTAPRTDRTLVFGFDEAAVVRLGWTAHPIGPYLTLERKDGGPWRRMAPTPGAVEQAPVASLLAALRGARWHREKPRDPRENAMHLAVDTDGKRLELWIGYGSADDDQRWIAIDDRAYLVDAWVARALTPSPIDLAIKTPLAGIANVPDYTVDGVRVEGTPRRALGVVLDPVFAGELERSLAELAIEDLPPGPMGHGEAIQVHMAGTTVAFGGPCEQRVYMAASTGDGCVARAKADVARSLVEKLHGPPAGVISRAIVPVGVERVVLADGGRLEVAKRMTVNNKEANPDEVAALMMVLRSPVDGVDLVPAPTTPILATVSVFFAGGGMELALHAGNLVHRRDEPLALRLAPAAFEILRRGALSYANLIPWAEEPTTIDELRVDGIAWKRGPVIGEWVRTPAGATDSASIEALVRALAQPRVVGVAPATVVRGRRIELVVRPPMGAEKSHTLELGAATAAGCPAKIDTNNILLPVEICRLVPR